LDVAQLVSLVLSPSGAITYLLRDEFTTDRGVGAVNGTPAEPGPGTRITVEAAGGAVSLVGGYAIMDGYAGSYSDPVLYYADIITRTAGRLAKMVVYFPGASIGGCWGFNAVPGGWNIAEATATSSGNRIRFNGIDTDGLVAAGSAIPIVITLRATGYHVLYKSPTTGQWILAWVSATGATAALNVGGFANYGNDTNVQPDYIRVPANLWVPAPLASDSFNRANGSLNASVTDGAAVEEAGGAGQTWTATNWTIAGNVALNTPTTGGNVIVNGAFAADTDWVHGVGWSIAAGVASIAGAASTDETAAVAPLTTNVWYQVTFDITALAAGSVGAVLGANVLRTKASIGTGLVSTGVATGTAFCLRGVAATLSIDNVACRALTLSTLVATVPVSSPDVLVELPITDGASNAGAHQVGIVVNLDDPANPQNFIIAYLNGNAGVQLDEYVAGVRTAKIAATAVTYSAGAKLKVVRSDTSCSVYYNEAQVGTTQTMTANTNVNHGMLATRNVPTVNNLAIWPRGTGGEYSRLDAF
jgi:hypothetical protein